MNKQLALWENLYKQLLRKIDEQAGQLFSLQKTYLACKAGCYSCCKDDFSVRFIEGWALWQKINCLTSKKIKKSKTTEGLCILLDENGHCSSYKDRPLLCRAYGLLVTVDGNMRKCHLNYTTLGSTKDMLTLNLDPFYNLADELSNELWTLHHQHLPEEFPSKTPDFLPISQWLVFFEARKAKLIEAGLAT